MRVISSLWFQIQGEGAVLEPAYTSVEVMKILHENGIRTGRERVNRMADALFGRDTEQKHRRISLEQMSVIREAFHLIDVEGFPRQLVIEMYAHPNKVTDALSKDIRRSKTALADAAADAESGLSRFQKANSTDERLEAARHIPEDLLHYPQGSSSRGGLDRSSGMVYQTRRRRVRYADCSR